MRSAKYALFHGAVSGTLSVGVVYLLIDSPTLAFVAGVCFASLCAYHFHKTL